MKNLILGIALVAALAACGGGGSSPGVTPPTVAPPTISPVSYAVAIIASGGDMPAGYGTKAPAARQAQTAPTPLPVLITAPDSNTFGIGYSPGTGDTTATITVTVSPSPSQSPTTTFAVSGSGLTTTPATDGTGKAIPNEIVVVANSLGQSVTGSVNASVASPVSQQQAVTVIQYNRITLNCGSSGQYGYAPSGVAIQSGAIVPVTDPTQADLYLSGPNCSGAFAVGTTNAINFPYGGGYFADSFKAYNDLAISDFPASPITSMASSLDGDFSGSTIQDNDLMIFKTKDGETVAIRIVGATGNAGPGQPFFYSGPIKVHGSAPDGF